MHAYSESRYQFHSPLQQSGSKMPRISRNGLGFCQSQIQRIGHRALQGKPTYVVFDIDNTLVDTRYRTLAAAKTYALRIPFAQKMSKIRFCDVRYDGESTAKQCGLSQTLCRGFQDYWNEYFWHPRHFKADKRIRETSQLARKAKWAGAEVLYLTGRIETLKDATIAELKRFGLPDADAAHVMCKPTMNTPTPAFKKKVVLDMLKEKRHLSWFMSDSLSDIKAIQEATPVPCVWVHFPVNPKIDLCAVPIHPSTPTIRIR